MMGLMTTKRLIQLLQEADPEGTRSVILQGDPEGNYYHDTHSVWTGAINKRGDVGLEKLLPEDVEQGYTRDDVVKGRKAVIIVPR